MSMLIFIFCILYLILAYRYLDWAIMFLIVALPAYLIRFNIFGVPFTVLEAMVLISFFVWIMQNYKTIIDNFKLKLQITNHKSQISKRYPFDIEIILLLIISFVSVAVAGFSDSALGTWKAYFFEPAILFILILNLFQGKRGVKKILWSLLVSAFLVSVFAVYQKFTGAFIFNEFWRAEETRRVTSFFGYPNAVGLYLGPIVMVLVGFLFSQIKNVKSQIFNFQFSIFKQFLIFNFKIFETTIIFLGIIGPLLSIYFAKSEGALIGILVGLGVFGILSGKKARLATIGLILIASLGIVIYTPARNYAIDKVTLNDFSGQVRRVQWRETKKMLLDGRVIFGAGLANYKKTVAPYHQEGFFVDNGESDFLEKVRASEEFRKKVWQPLEIYLYPHNIFLNFWSELGLAGMILFIWIIGKYLYVGLKIIRNWKLETGNLSNKENQYLILGLVGAMIVIVIHGFVDVPYFKNDLAIIFWVMIAIFSLVDLSIKNDSINNKL